MNVNVTHLYAEWLGHYSDWALWTLVIPSYIVALYTLVSLFYIVIDVCQPKCLVKYKVQEGVNQPLTTSMDESRVTFGIIAQLPSTNRTNIVDASANYRQSGAALCGRLRYVPHCSCCRDPLPGGATVSSRGSFVAVDHSAVRRICLLLLSSTAALGPALPPHPQDPPRFDAPR